MSVSWNKDYNPVPVIEKLESTRRIGDNGQTQFEGTTINEFKTLLYSMLTFPSDIPEFDARSIVAQAQFRSGDKGVITTKSYLAEVNKLEKEYQTQPIERYALASSISINPLMMIHRIRFENNLIVFERLLPAKFRQESGKLLKNAELSLFASPPIDYLFVRIHVPAKTIHGAAKQALETIDFVRGVWNLTLNRGQYFRMSWGGQPKPVNLIILGPLHTLHKPSGELAAKNNWWFEPSYLGAIKPLSLQHDELGNLYKSLDHVKRKFKKHKYSNVLFNAVVRYTRALDERDWTTAFIKLWGILELLTDTTRDKYDVTIRRTAFIYQEREYHYQVLQHLREYRNLSIHFDKGNSEIETCLYQIKNYVEALISFHINNKYGFESVQEAAGFLSLSHEEKALKDQIEKLKYARKFRGYA
jgi:hypothetical protein